MPITWKVSGQTLTFFGFSRSDTEFISYEDIDDGQAEIIFDYPEIKSFWDHVYNTDELPPLPTFKSQILNFCTVRGIEYRELTPHGFIDYSVGCLGHSTHVELSFSQELYSVRRPVLSPASPTDLFSPHQRVYHFQNQLFHTISKSYGDECTMVGDPFQHRYAKKDLVSFAHYSERNPSMEPNEDHDYDVIVHIPDCDHSGKRGRKCDGCYNKICGDCWYVEYIEDADEADRRSPDRHCRKCSLESIYEEAVKEVRRQQGIDDEDEEKDGEDYEYYCDSCERHYSSEICPFHYSSLDRVRR